MQQKQAIITLKKLVRLLLYAVSTLVLMHEILAFTFIALFNIDEFHPAANNLHVSVNGGYVYVASETKVLRSAQPIDTPTLSKEPTFEEVFSLHQYRIPSDYLPYIANLSTSGDCILIWVVDRPYRIRVWMPFVLGLPMALKLGSFYSVRAYRFNRDNSIARVDIRGFKTKLHSVYKVQDVFVAAGCCRNGTPFDYTTLASDGMDFRNKVFEPALPEERYMTLERALSGIGLLVATDGNRMAYVRLFGETRRSQLVVMNSGDKSNEVDIPLSFFVTDAYFMGSDQLIVVGYTLGKSTAVVACLTYDGKVKWQSSLSFDRLY